MHETSSRLNANKARVRVRASVGVRVSVRGSGSGVRDARLWVLGSEFGAQG